MRIKEYIKVDWNKFLYFLKKFSKEIIIAFILAVVAAIIYENFKEETSSQILRNNSKAMATIFAGADDNPDAALGSGFFVNPEGLLVTNYHVIEKAKGVIFGRLPSGAIYKYTKTIGSSKKYDLAILQFDAHEVPYVKVDYSKRIKAGDKVFAIGSPVGLENTVSDGIISNPNRISDGMELIQFTAPISPGSSGGGLFDRFGKVIGITSGSFEVPTELKNEAFAQNLNFAVPAHFIKDAYTKENEDFSENSPNYFYGNGMVALNKKEYDKAMGYFNRAIELDKNYGEAYVELGEIYYEKGQYDLEVEVLSKAITLIKDDPDVYSSLAAAYEDKKQYDSAIENYKKALTLRPKDKDTLYALGILYLVQGDKQEASGYISKIFPLDAGLAGELEKIMEQMK